MLVWWLVRWIYNVYRKWELLPLIFCLPPSFFSSFFLYMCFLSFFFLPKDQLPHFWSTFDVRWKFFSLKCELSQLKQRAYNNPSSESQIHITRRKNTINPVWVMCIVLVQSIVTRAGADLFSTNMAAQNHFLTENISCPIIRVP